MKKMLRIELKKAFFSKSFLAGLGILLLLSFLSGLYMIENWSEYNPNAINSTYIKNGEIVINPIIPVYSFFCAWLGGDTLSLAGTMFFYFLPVGAALPYAWSYHTERKCGYIKNVITRTSRKKYYASKSIAVFSTGAIVILIPYIVNIFMVSAFIPCIKPWTGYNMYNFVYFGTLWSDLFFTKPIIHTLFYVLLNSLYGGLFALLSFSISMYIKNIIPIIFSPFLIIIIAGYLENVIYEKYFANSLLYYELVPTYFLRSRDVHYMSIGWVITIETLILFLVSVIPIFIIGRKWKNELN